MDATTLGSLLVGVGAVVGGVVAYLGKRGENAMIRFNSLTDQVQEECNRLERQLAAKETEVVALHLQHHEDLIENTRLRIKIIQLGGEP